MRRPLSRAADRGGPSNDLPAGGLVLVSGPTVSGGACPHDGRDLLFQEVLVLMMAGICSASLRFLDDVCRTEGVPQERLFWSMSVLFPCSHGQFLAQRSHMSRLYASDGESKSAAESDVLDATWAAAALTRGLVLVFECVLAEGRPCGAVSCCRSKSAAMAGVSMGSPSPVRRLPSLFA